MAGSSSVFSRAQSAAALCRPGASSTDGWRASWAPQDLHNPNKSEEPATCGPQQHRWTSGWAHVLAPTAASQVARAWRRPCGRAPPQVDLIARLLYHGDGNEPAFLMRSLHAKLRVGVAEPSVLLSLAHAALLHQEGQVGMRVRRVVF